MRVAYTENHNYTVSFIELYDNKNHYPKKKLKKNRKNIIKFEGKSNKVGFSKDLYKYY